MLGIEYIIIFMGGLIVADIISPSDPQTMSNTITSEEKQHDTN